MGVELAPVGVREEASDYEAPPSKSFLDGLLTFLCKCCACRRRDWLPLPTDDDDLAPPKRGRRRARPADRCRFSDQKPGHSIHSTCCTRAKSPLRVGRAGGALKLSPTVELFVYDDEDGPNSRRGLAPGSVGREPRQGTSFAERGRRRLGAPGRRGGGAHPRGTESEGDGAGVPVAFSSAAAAAAAGMSFIFVVVPSWTFFYAEFPAAGLP